MLRIRTSDGEEFDARPGQVTTLPSGHDAWVVGDEPVVVVDWWGASHYAEVRAAMDDAQALPPVRRRVRGAGRAASATAGTRRRRAPGWDVRALVRHVVEEELWAPPLLAGATIAEVGDRFAGDQLGDDPLGAFERAHAAALTAVDEAPDRDVHLSFGDTPRAEYTLQLAADHLVHAWDLARAVGEDDTLDPGPSRPSASGSGRWRTPTAARA